MLKNKILILVCFIVHTLVYGQRQIIDSLFQTLPTIRAQDSLAMTYLQIAKHYYYLPNQRDSLFLFVDKAIQTAQSARVDHLIQKAVFTKGAAHFKVGAFESGLVYLEQADSIAQVMLDTPAIITANTAMGNIYYQTGEYDQSIAAYTQAATLCELTKQHRLSIPCYANIANILANQKRNQEALHYFRLAIGQARLVQDDYMELTTLSNAIVTYKVMGLLDSAFIHAQYLRDKSEAIDYQEGIIYSHIRLSSLYNHQGAFEQAIATADKIIHSGTNYAPEFLFSAYHNKAIALDSLGRFSAARGCGQKCLELAKQTNILGNYAQAYELLYHLHKKLALFEPALRYHERYKILADSALGEKNSKTVIGLQKRYEKEKQDRQIAELSQVNIQQRATLNQRNATLFIVVLIGCLIGGLLYYQSKINQWKRIEERTKLEQRFWRAQLNPHFFFNALSAIKKLLYEQKDSQTVGQYLTQLAHLMRQTLEYNVHDYISLEDELDVVKNYLDIQRFRFEQNFDYAIEVPPNIDQEATLIPPMLIQPFLENAIEHGKLMQRPGGKVWLKISLKSDDCLQLHIEDNGIGIKPDQRALFLPLHANSIIKERLRLFSKQHKQPFALQVKARQPEGTTVQLDIPIEYSF